MIYSYASTTIETGEHDSGLQTPGEDYKRNVC